MAFGRMGACVLALLLAFACGAPARAATATAVGSMQPEGFARLVFTFDSLPKSQARLANGVLVVSFARPVKIDVEQINHGLGDLIGAVKADPDGTSLRIALIKPAKLSVNEAGEALYVDLLPATWVGLPPGLPKDVVAALGDAVRQARAAQAKQAGVAGLKLTPLTLDGATHPTFRRLVFGVEDQVSVEMKRTGTIVAVTFGAPLPFDLAAAKALLPPELAAIEATRSATALTIVATAPEGVEARGFRESGSYVLDIDRKDAAPASPAAGQRPSAAPAAGDGHGQPPSQTAEAAAADGKPNASPPAVAASAPPAAPAHPAADAPAPAAAAAARVETRMSGDTLRVSFPFAKLPTAAVFRRGRTVWALFDDPAPLALDGMVAASGGAITSVAQGDVDDGRLVRLTLREPRLVTAATDGTSWVVSFGDDLLGASDTIAFAADFGRDGRGAVAARFERIGRVRSLVDPDVGDRLLVATLPAPTRGLARPQSFVEFTLLATAQGVAVAPLAEDVRLTPGIDDLRIERDEGLSLSSDPHASPAVAAAPAVKLVFDETDAAAAVAEPYLEREHTLMEAAALAPPEKRTAARLALARFYAFRRMPADAKAVLDTILAEDGLAERDPTVAVLRAAASAELGQTKLARAILAAPQLSLSPEAALWRAVAEADDGRPGAARDALRQGQPALEAMPPDFKARFVELSVRLALDMKDQAAALAAFDQLEVLPAIYGVGARELLRARVLEALGQTDKALSAYAAVAAGSEPVPAAEAVLRGVELGLSNGRTSIGDATQALERLVTGWRGDWIEAEGLTQLAGLYADAERWRDAFGTLKTAVEAFPDVDDTRKLQDRMQARFTDLFLGPALDKMPKLDALALFYDFQNLSPGGRRGDELVRRLADKLVEVDLLEQAAKLLDYQIDNRLSGAARAQVAARAALVHLMNGKPTEAARVLRRTRQADLPASLVQTRLALEARSLAQGGRVDIGLEMAAGIEGPEGARLRADILWNARRWMEAGEALEAALGSAWRGSEPLDAAERADVMRAGIALSLADDKLGLDRIRQKFAPKISQSADAQAFEVVTAPIEARGDAFREIARSIATTAALEGFLKDYRRRSAEDAPKPERAVETAARDRV